MGAIRFYLAMTVVLAHSAVSSPVLDAHFSVLLFFAISGFCMALVLNEKYTEPSPTRFYLARFLRLWPTYIVVALLTWITLRPLGDATHANFWGAVYFYFSSTSLFGHGTLWWFSLPPDGSVIAMDTTIRSPHAARMTQMQHMWSVGVELAFYAVSPLFARAGAFSFFECADASVFRHDRGCRDRRLAAREPPAHADADLVRHRIDVREPAREAGPRVAVAAVIGIEIFEPQDQIVRVGVRDAGARRPAVERVGNIRVGKTDAGHAGAAAVAVDP